MTGNQPHRLSRRGFCLCCIAAGSFGIAGGWLSPRQAYAEARNIVDFIRGEAAKATITTHKLRGSVFVLEGSGGNIAVYAGPDGKVLIDAGITATRPRIAQALTELGTQPITNLINTHWHFDHADGNEWLHGEGAVIMAHANTRKHLSEAQRVDDWDFNFPSSPSGAIPSQTLDSDRTVELAGYGLQLSCYEPAHTDGDIAVRFVADNILHTGDTYWNGVYPFIDSSTGGSIDGMIAASQKTLSLVDDDTIIVPGHGQPLSNRSELSAFRDMLVAIRENVATLKNQGKTLEETVAAKPTQEFDQKWGQFVIGPDFFTKLVYEGV